MDRDVYINFSGMQGLSSESFATARLTRSLESEAGAALESHRKPNATAPVLDPTGVESRDRACLA